MYDTYLEACEATVTRQQARAFIEEHFPDGFTGTVYTVEGVRHVENADP